jgi:outer membrane protein assembly factor BamB
LVAVAESLYVLDLADGKVRQRFEWKDGRAGDAEVTPQGLFVALRPPSSCPQPKLSLDTRILLIKRSGAQRTVTFDGGWPHLRRAGATGLVYSSHQTGVDVLSPTTGVLLFKLMVTGSSSRGSVDLVDVKENVIYALTGSGHVYALRHP